MKETKSKRLEDFILTHGSFFSGLGGIDEGARRAGIETLYNCEIEDTNRLILRKHNPKAIQFSDIRNVNSNDLPKADVVSGGFPCQDISIAGTGKGLEGKRSGLYFEFFRLYRELRPKYVFIENVPALTFRGLTTIIADFAKIGYCCEWRCLRVSDFYGPHERERLLLVAYPGEVRCKFSVFLDPEDANCRNKAWEITQNFKQRRQWEHWLDSICTLDNWKSANGEFFRVDDRPPKGLLKDRIAGIGNAVCPVVAEYIFTCIQIHWLFVNGLA